MASNSINLRHRPVHSTVTKHWREELLAAVLAATLALGSFATIVGAKVALEQGMGLQIVINLAALSVTAFLWRQRSLPYRVRVWSALTLITCFGFMFLIRRGTYGLLYLSAVPILTALLAGLRPATCVLGLTTAGIVASGYFLQLPTSMSGSHASLLVNWSLLGLSFLIVGGLVTVSTGVLLRNLDRAILREQASQEELRHLAHFDQLTGLPNRRMLMDRISQALQQSQRHGRRGAILFIDLDHFKNVNDTHGHGVGDEYLQAVAGHLQQHLRQSDVLGRLGGDEFVVLLSDLSEELNQAAHLAMTTAEKVRLALSEPIELQRGTFLSSASIGVAMFPSDGKTTDDLLREADTAMYRAKETGRNRIAFFETHMQTELQKRIQLEQDLSKAIEQGALSLVMQSQVDQQGHVIGAEALTRWNHPVKGFISPDQFIPVAEDTGLIVLLGEQVLDKACALIAALPPSHSHLTVSVNISPRQFRQNDFHTRVVAILQRYPGAASSLIFEVTEGLLIKDIDEIVDRMHEFAKLGIRFSIDDFGTGYSSLSYLKRLPLYELKIDKSFVQDTPGDANDTAIVRLVMSMAAELGLKVVAEGVETAEQSAFLVAHGCDCMQGYLYAKPQAVDTWLAALQTEAVTQ